jgi:transmembrane sensor
MGLESGERLDDAHWEALARYFADESSPAESIAVREWLAAHPEDARTLMALDAVSARSGHGVPGDIDVDAAWTRVAASLEAPVVRPMRRDAPVSAWARAPRWPAIAMRAAAALLLVTGVGLIWKYRHESPVNPAVTARTMATGPGQRDSVVLADGTGVLLGPGSSIRVADDFGTDRRDVQLDGEALFDVRHDARPFVVHASGVMIQDLGTTFTVRAVSGGAGATTVAVTAGSVRLTRAAGSAAGVDLRAGDIGLVPRDGAIEVRRSASLDDELAWTRGQLVFHSTPLPVVAASLHRWYGVNVEIADTSLNERTWEASFQGEPLATVLAALESAMDVRVERRDSTVVIHQPEHPSIPHR